MTKLRAGAEAQAGRRLPEKGKPGYNPNTPEPEAQYEHAPHWLQGKRGHRREWFAEEIASK